jgi:hypothetical protein
MGWCLARDAPESVAQFHFFPAPLAKAKDTTKQAKSTIRPARGCLPKNSAMTSPFVTAATCRVVGGLLPLLGLIDQKLPGLDVQCVRWP